METSSYFSVLQRRWKLVVACFAVGLVAGFMLTPSNPKTVGNQWTSSIDIVLAPESADNKDFSLTTVKWVSDAGEVAKQVGAKLHQDPAVLAGRITTGVNGEVGTLTITAKDATKTDAETLARAWADTTVAVFKDQQRAQLQAAADAKKPGLDKLSNDIAALEQQITQAPAAKKGLLQAERDSKMSSYQTQLNLQGKLADPLFDPRVIVQDNLRSTPQAATSILAPTSRPLRLALAAALGLALGLVAALMVDRMDMRLRNRMQVEDAFGMPVIAEVPRASRRMRAGHALLVAARPGSPVAEAYRSLRSALLLSGPPGLAFRLGEAPRTGLGSSLPVRQFTDPAPVILVVSPKPGDGRTTTVGNLAAALAEAGRSVLVLDCDFRNPEAHLYLGTKPGTGLSELLLSERETDLQHVIRATEIPHVRMITGGAPTSYPAALLLRVGEVIARARHHADVVLLDSAPLLFANDTNDLIQHSDAMLVVTKSGNLTPDQASRVSELLTRTGVPVAGIALIGTDPSSVGVRSGRGRFGPAVPGAGLILRGRAAAQESPEDGERSAPSWARRPELGDGTAPVPAGRSGDGEEEPPSGPDDKADDGVAGDSFVHTAELRTITVRPGEPRGFSASDGYSGSSFLDDDPADLGYFPRPGRSGGEDRS